MTCAKLPCGNFDLENCLHGGHKTEQMVYSLLCLIDIVVAFCVSKAQVNNRLNYSRAKVVSHWNERKIFFLPSHPLLHFK